jgi:hypothetical protein
VVLKLHLAATPGTQTDSTESAGYCEVVLKRRRYKKDLVCTMAAFGDVTRLFNKVESADLRNVKIVKKTSGGVKKKAAVKETVSVKDKETAASKNWQRDRHADEIITHHITKLETDFHARLRAVEDKYANKITLLEGRTMELEKSNSKQESVILELLKRIHNTHKTDKEELAARIERVEEGVEKAALSSVTTSKSVNNSLNKAKDTMAAHKKEMTNLMYRLDNLDRRVDNRLSHEEEEDEDRSMFASPATNKTSTKMMRKSVTPKKKKKKSVNFKAASAGSDHSSSKTGESPLPSPSPSPSPYKYSRPHMSGSIPLQHDISSLKYEFMALTERVNRLAKKRTLSQPGTYAEPTPAGLEEFLEKVQELQGDMNALNKHTHKALKTQDAAIMCLYRNSDFRSKMRTTPQELIEVFGRLSESDEYAQRSAQTMFGVSPAKKKGGGGGVGHQHQQHHTPTKGGTYGR